MRVSCCAVCGFPIMQGVCLHTLLNISAEQWLHMSREEQQAVLRDRSGQSRMR